MHAGSVIIGWGKAGLEYSVTTEYRNPPPKRQSILPKGRSKRGSSEKEQVSTLRVAEASAGWKLPEAGLVREVGGARGPAGNPRQTH